MDYDTFVEKQKQYPRTVGNDYLLPTELQRRFSYGVMTTGSDDRALFLYEKREGFTKLHFRLLNTSAKLKPPDGTLAAYLTYRQSRPPETAAGWLLDQGFSKTKTLRRHTATQITGNLSTDGVERAAVDETYAMLGEHFSAEESDLPCRELFEGALCIRSQEGSLIGALYMGQTLSVAVATEARGQGTGRKLYRAYAAIKAGEDKKTTFHEWISPDNTASLAMFNNLGFTPDDVQTDIYVIKMPTV